MPRRSANPQHKAAPTAQNYAVSAGLTTPLQHMLGVLNDPTAAPNRKDRMAIAAAPYCHARLAEKTKKAAEAEAAQQAGEGGEWADDLHPDGWPRPQ